MTEFLHLLLARGGVKQPEPCWNFVKVPGVLNKNVRKRKGELQWNSTMIDCLFLSFCYLRNMFECMKRLRPRFPVRAQKDLPAQSSFTATKPQLLKTTSIRKAGQVLPLLPKLRIHQMANIIFDRQIL